MLALFETSAGFALFKCDDAKLSSVDDIAKYFENASSATTSKAIKLKAFSKFESTAAAVEALNDLHEGSISSSLKKFLKGQLKGIENEKLLISDSKLAKSIAKKFTIPVLSDSGMVMELMRGIRSQIASLLSGITESDLNKMSLGLSHSMSRHKLKFSPDKVDTMIIQAIALLDDLDKELNTYSMRLKEWYGWHFPEMTKVLVDNIAYSKVVQRMGFRTNAINTDFSDILPEDLEKEIKSLAEVSMGTEISQEDLLNINHLAEQVISLSAYRTELFDYLKNRMAAIAPNLTALVGELVGARLISHAGSLVNLAKHPASTVQILGAEKALFRALKTKQNTPKYGLIFHASLIGQAGAKLKGKMARVLAAKSALSVRVDAFSDASNKSAASAELGLADRAKVEQRLRQLERRAATSSFGSARGAPGTSKKYEFVSSKTYNSTADVTFKSSPAPKIPLDIDVSEAKDATETKSGQHMVDFDEKKKDTLKEQGDHKNKPSGQKKKAGAQSKAADEPEKASDAQKHLNKKRPAEAELVPEKPKKEKKDEKPKQSEKSDKKDKSSKEEKLDKEKKPKKEKKNKD